jgi:outer membrane PBP1 activator LpoA protein
MCRFRSLIFFCTLATLAACSTPPQHPDTASPPVASKERMFEEALGLRDDGKFSDAADIMIKMSEHTLNDDRAQYLFEAAQLYLSIPDASRADDILQKLIGGFPNSGYTKILGAQILLHEGKPVLTSLESTPPPDVNDDAKSIYWLTLAKANEACIAPSTESAENVLNSNGKPIIGSPCLVDSLRARAEANDSLRSLFELARNQDAIWEIVSAQSPSQLQQIKSKAKNTTLKAWIDLALLTKKSKHAVSEADIKAWSLKYPDQVVLNQRLLEIRGLHLEEIKHLAVILPTKSKDLGPFAKIIWEGFQSAQKKEADSYPAKLYETDASPAAMLNAYQSALDKGANMVIGPLSRNSLALLTQKRLLAVPTIALNVADDEKFPINLYQFGLPITQEARLVARHAEAKYFKDAIVLKGSGALDSRSSEAFTSEWIELNKKIKVTLSIQDLASVRQLVAAGLPSSTMVFIAADFQDALPAIKIMPETWTVFGTSALNTASPDLAQLNKEQKIYFVDIPNLEGKSALLNGASPPPQKDIVSSRLYALGVDASHLSELLMRKEIKFNRPILNGETGKLSVTRNGNVERDLPLFSLLHASLSSTHADTLAKLAPADGN